MKKKNNLLEPQWKGKLKDWLEEISNDINIEDKAHQDSLSNLILNRILLVFTFIHKFNDFEDIDIARTSQIHKSVIIPILKKLRLSTNINEVSKENGSHTVNNFLLYPSGMEINFFKVNVSDTTYKTIFQDFSSFIEIGSLNNLSDLFFSPILGDLMEESHSRTDKKGTGTFYTPNYLTDQMAAYAIENYFKKRLSKNFNLTFLSKTLSSELFSDEKFIETLKDLKILDNSVGCGEYLLSCLKYLAKVYVSGFKSQRNHLHFNIIREIIIHNLYGVDLDANAIDICKTRLLGAFILEIRNYSEIYPIPNLDLKIKIGNSLIGRPLPLTFNQTKLAEELRKHSHIEMTYDFVLSHIFGKNKASLNKIQNCFHWDIEFLELFRNSKGNYKGFSIIIGNPPFLSTKRSTLVFSLLEKQIYSKMYSLAQLQWDIYELFVERSFSLLQEEGCLCYLLPKPFLTNKNMEPLRNLILTNSTIKLIVETGPTFPNVGVETVVLVIEKEITKNSLIQIGNLNQSNSFEMDHTIPQSFFIKFPSFRIVLGLTERIISYIEVIKNRSIPFEDFIKEFSRGIECGKQNPDINQEGIGFPLIRGEDVKRYSLAYRNYFIRYQENNKQKFKDLDLYQGEKILVRRVASGIIAIREKGEYYFLNTLYAIKLKKDCNISFILALLNSKILNWWFNQVYSFDEVIFPYLRKSQINQIPIINRINENNPRISHTLNDYKIVISLFSEFIQFLFKKKDKKIANKIDQDLLDPLIFELYFKDELGSNLLGKLLSESKKFQKLDSKEEKFIALRNIVRNEEFWLLINDQINKIRKNEIYLTTMRTRKFENVWKKIITNK